MRLFSDRQLTSELLLIFLIQLSTPIFLIRNLRHLNIPPLSFDSYFVPTSNSYLQNRMSRLNPAEKIPGSTCITETDIHELVFLIIRLPSPEDSKNSPRENIWKLRAVATTLSEENEWWDRIERSSRNVTGEGSTLYKGYVKTIIIYANCRYYQKKYSSIRILHHPSRSIYSLLPHHSNGKYYQTRYSIRRILHPNKGIYPLQPRHWKTKYPRQHMPTRQCDADNLQLKRFNR
jgi:hypothetical protein